MEKEVKYTKTGLLPKERKKEWMDHLLKLKCSHFICSIIILLAETNFYKPWETMHTFNYMNPGYFTLAAIDMRL